MAKSFLLNTDFGATGLKYLEHGMRHRPSSTDFGQMGENSRKLLTKVLDIGNTVEGLGLIDNNTLGLFRGIFDVFFGTPQPNIYLTTIVNGNKYEIWLQEGEEDFTFDNSISWEEASPVGRSSPLFSYSNSDTMRFTINGTMRINSAGDERDYDNYMRSLKAMKYPVRLGNGIGAPPLWSFAVFDEYKRAVVLDPMMLRILNVTWTLRKPYLQSGKPVVTNVVINVAVADENITEASQVSYKDKISGAVRDKYFEDIAYGRKVGG